MKCPKCNGAGEVPNQRYYNMSSGEAYVDWIDGGINTNDANPADYIREHIHKQ